MVISAPGRLSAVGLSITATAAALLMLTGCAQPRLRSIAPEPAAGARGVAYQGVMDVTTIPDGGSAAVLVGDRFRDGCGLSASGQFLQSDYTREFLCEAGRVALYAVPTDTEMAAAGVVDSALLDMGCATSKPLSSQNIEEAEDSNSSAEPISTFFATYVCGSAEVSATLGKATNQGFSQKLEQAPATIMDTPVVDNPALGVTELAAVREQDARYAVFLSTVDRYFTTTLCRDLQPCGDVAN